MYKYFPHTEADISEMLGKIGLSSLDELYAEIPENIRFDKDYDLKKSMSEDEVRNYFRELGKTNKKLIPFAGGGAYDHYAPAVIGQLISRSEYLTAYTPYQPEISQGTLQYIFEFQSMICELTGMECCNASMYDGATAAAEAMLMSIAHAKKRNKVIVSRTLNPRVIEVVETYARFHGVNLEMIPEKKASPTKPSWRNCSKPTMWPVLLQVPRTAMESSKTFPDSPTMLMHTKRCLSSMPTPRLWPC